MLKTDGIEETQILADVLKKKRETPWMDGNRFAEKHGFYAERWSEEDKAARRRMNICWP